MCQTSNLDLSGFESRRGFQENLLTLYIDYIKVYGPYIHSGLGRRVVYLIGKGNKRKAITYARALLQIKESRLFDLDKTVDHIDNNKLNDSIENLQILSLKENAKKSNGDLGKEIYICQNCRNEFIYDVASYRKNRKANKSGPYCNRSCASQANRARVITRKSQ